MTTRPSDPAPAERQRDADRTRAEILEVAGREFARLGYDGARVDEIAALTRTTKRMIYYYFGGKERLYIKVLEDAYARVREVERSLDVERLGPVEAMRTLAELTFDYHETHGDFIRLVSIENIHHAEHIRKSTVLRNLGSPAVELLDRILQAGRASGAFTTEADAVEVHILMSSFCFFRIANQHTFDALFDHDMTAASSRDRLRHMVGDMVIAYLRGQGDRDPG